MTNAISIKLTRSPHQYNIYIDAGLLASQANGLIQAALPNRQKLLVITHDSLWQRYGQTLNLSGFEVRIHAVPEGETSKSLEHLNGVWLAAQQAGLTRRDAFVAFGGGVIGDLTGFAAATYYRGMPFIQIPTTLLAQVDSSVGGKTGINVGPVKNSVGVFNQPALVLIDPLVLNTLPEREITAGLAEVLKYALIETTCTGQPATLWTTLSHYNNRAALMRDIELIIRQCCQIKASVVAQDETEQTGLRALLNLGHTFGHALEADGNYTTYLHGEAVAIGTLWACQLAQQLGMVTAAFTQAVVTVWQQLGLPVQPLISHNAIQLLERMHQDKKNTSQDNITLILPKDLPGNVLIKQDVPVSAIQTFLDAKCSVSV